MRGLARALRGHLFAPCDGLAEGSVEAVASANDIEANRLLQTAVGLREEVAAQKFEQGSDFVLGPAPVVSREGVQRQGANSVAYSRCDRPIDGIGARAMTLPTGLAAFESPATVAIHDDGYVHIRVLFVAEFMEQKKPTVRVSS